MDRLADGEAIGLRVLVIVGITLIYAACYAVIKVGLAFAPPLYFAGLRALLAGVTLLGLAFILGAPILPSGVAWSELLALAITATTLTFGAMFLSPGRTGAGIASVLGNTQALFTLAAAVIFLGERITPGKLAGLFPGFAGVILIAYPALTAADAYRLSGALLALAASGGAAAGNVIFKRMGTRSNVLTITAWQLMIGSLPLLALSALTERGAGITWNGEFIGSLLFLALVGTSLAATAWYALIQRDDVGRLTLFFFLIPAFGLAIAVVVFGEQISLLQSLGAALTVAGMIPTAWEVWRRAPLPRRASA